MIKPGSIIMYKNDKKCYIVIDIGHAGYSNCKQTMCPCYGNNGCKHKHDRTMYIVHRNRGEENYYCIPYSWAIEVCE